MKKWRNKGGRASVCSERGAFGVVGVWDGGRRAL